MNLIFTFLSTLILSSVQVYAWYKIAGKKIDFINIKGIMIIVLLTIFSMANFYIVNAFLRILFMCIGAIIFCKILLKLNTKNCIIISCLDEFLILISDALFGLTMLVLLGSDIPNVINSYAGTIIADIFTSVIIIAIVNTKYLPKFYKFLMKHTINIKENQLVIFLFIVICCVGSIFAITYYNDNPLITIITNIVISLIYAIIVLIILHTKNNYIAMNSKYHTNLDDLQAQESIIQDYRIINHENKNQLLTIKSMTKNKQIIGYIDSLINQKNQLKNDLITLTMKLPEGGIRGLIYSKLVIMKENDIKCYLNVDKRISAKTLADINSNDIVNICQILGVFIDNAIQETMKLDKKEISIDLHIYDQKLVISVVNNHNQMFKNEKNNSILKTTKGKGHGYGLQLVKKIVENNDKITNERQITKDAFAQKIIIELK